VRGGKPYDFATVGLDFSPGGTIVDLTAGCLDVAGNASGFCFVDDQNTAGECGVGSVGGVDLDYIVRGEGGGGWDHSGLGMRLTSRPSPYAFSGGSGAGAVSVAVASPECPAACLFAG
jgi:hypothetical protein